jgi:hypothetical protein
MTSSTFPRRLKRDGANRYYSRVKLRNSAVTAIAVLLGLLAALFALGNSRVPVVGIVLCPALLVVWPVFDEFPDLADGWLWAATAVVNSLTYVLLTRLIAGYFRLRSRTRGPAAS